MKRRIINQLVMYGLIIGFYLKNIFLLFFIFEIGLANSADYSIKSKNDQIITEDKYEEDDSKEFASIITINDKNPQKHNFHKAQDEDWVKFYAISGIEYQICVINAGKNCNAVIELFDLDDNKIKSVNKGLNGDNEELVWKCEKKDIYYVKIKHYDNDQYGINTEYSLEIMIPKAPVFFCDIIGNIKDSCTEYPIDEVKIETSASQTAISQPNGDYSIQFLEVKSESYESYTIYATKKGYIDYSKQIFVNDRNLEIIKHQIYLKKDINFNGIIDLSDAIILLQEIVKLNDIGKQDYHVHNNACIADIICILNSLVK